MLLRAGQVGVAETNDSDLELHTKNNSEETVPRISTSNTNGDAKLISAISESQEGFLGDCSSWDEDGMMDCVNCDDIGHTWHQQNSDGVKPNWKQQNPNYQDSHPPDPPDSGEALNLSSYHPTDSSYLDSREAEHLPSYLDCFSTFCQQTILHGWHYLTDKNNHTQNYQTNKNGCCCTCVCSNPDRTLRYTNHQDQDGPLHYTNHQDQDGPLRYTNHQPFNHHQDSHQGDHVEGHCIHQRRRQYTNGCCYNPPLQYCRCQAQPLHNNTGIALRHDCHPQCHPVTSSSHPQCHPVTSGSHHQCHPVTSASHHSTTNGGAHVNSNTSGPRSASQNGIHNHSLLCNTQTTSTSGGDSGGGSTCHQNLLIGGGGPGTGSYQHHQSALTSFDNSSDFSDIKLSSDSRSQYERQISEDCIGCCVRRCAGRGSKDSDNSVYRNVFWTVIVFASVVSGGFFLHDNTSEFLKSTVQTTLDSMVPLSQVLFPSVVVCNINQIRKSFFNELGFFENETLVRIMYEDFIKGTKDNSDSSNYTGLGTENDEAHDLKRKEFYEVLKSYLISRNISVNKSIIWQSHQSCDDMFIYSKWNSSTTYTHGENMRDFGTDYGICCWYTPQLNFSAIPYGPDTDWNYWFGTVTKGAKTGKDNGFSVLYDIEAYDYGYYDEGSEGLKVAINHHLDMPIMRQRAFHVAPGTENQIPITPTLYTANRQVLSRFTPEQRDCYQEHEIDLMYLPKSRGYRYEMSNCLFEAAFEKILEDCDCAPGFHMEGGDLAIKKYQVCMGSKLACSNEILNRMGQYSMVMDTVDNHTKECLSNCEDQMNDFFVTTSLYPNKKTFKDREEFCILGKKLLTNTCAGFKRLPLESTFPELCTALESLPDFLYQCRHNRWHRERIQDKEVALKIENEIYEYARSNLAIINIFIKEPYSKRFRKTEKMSRIAYIASSGGLLGLCMGFSFVSLAEILYHMFICVSLFFKKSSQKALLKRRRRGVCRSYS